MYKMMFGGKDPNNALHQSAKAGDLKKLQQCFEEGATVESKNKVTFVVKIYCDTVCRLLKGSLLLSYYSVAM